MEMKVIIAGSRSFNDYERLKKVCDRILSNLKSVTIVSGCARGADQLGERYAKERGYEVMRFPADWDKLGKRAGIYRNYDMARNADALIAFDGGTPGTAHMIAAAKEKNLKVRVIPVCVI